jgi:RNA polymerase sigma-70 factor (ECF subfamily)
MIGRLINGAIEAVDPIRLSEAEPVTCELQVTRLYEEARDDVYRYLLTLGLAPPQAQEATQEVFLRLYADLQKGKRIDSLRGWVFRVAHNHGVTLRGRDGIMLPFDPELETRLFDKSANPEQALLDRERRLRLHHAVDALSDQQRNCLYLRAEGFRYREIAAILGISDSTVSEFLRRAITRLRKVLHA